MAGAEVAIVAIGIEGIDAAIWALSSFAISMGLTFILKDAGFEFRQLTEGKKDDIPKMIEEIQENYPKIKEYMRNNHRPFLDYTISSNIGLLILRISLHQLDLKSHQKNLFQNLKLFL